MGDTVQGAASTDYKFGDSDVAALRLSTVADVFADSSAAFLRRAVPHRRCLALDLGCGPGHSTRLIASTVRVDKVVGLDRSEAFLALAASMADHRVTFQRHDVTKPQLPVAGPDLLYARLLLSHLPDPPAVVARWVAQLAPGGLLLLDEVDRVTTEHPVAADYQQVVEGMLRHNGRLLEIGPTLATMADPVGVTRVDERLVSVTPTSCQVGRMFGLNLSAWRHDAFVANNFSSRWLAQLQTSLDAAAAGLADMPVTWTMRQLTFVK